MKIKQKSKRTFEIIAQNDHDYSKIFELDKATEIIAWLNNSGYKCKIINPGKVTENKTFRLRVVLYSDNISCMFKVAWG